MASSLCFNTFPEKLSHADTQLVQKNYQAASKIYTELLSDVRLQLNSLQRITLLSRLYEINVAQTRFVRALIHLNNYDTLISDILCDPEQIKSVINKSFGCALQKHRDYLYTRLLFTKNREKYYLSPRFVQKREYHVINLCQIMWCLAHTFPVYGTDEFDLDIKSIMQTVQLLFYPMTREFLRFYLLALNHFDALQGNELSEYKNLLTRISQGARKGLENKQNFRTYLDVIDYLRYTKVQNTKIGQVRDLLFSRMTAASQGNPEHTKVLGMYHTLSIFQQENLSEVEKHECMDTLRESLIQYRFSSTYSARRFVLLLQEVEEICVQYQYYTRAAWCVRQYASIVREHLGAEHLSVIINEAKLTYNQMMDRLFIRSELPDINAWGASLSLSELEPHAFRILRKLRALGENELAIRSSRNLVFVLLATILNTRDDSLDDILKLSSENMPLFADPSTCECLVTTLSEGFPLCRNLGLLEHVVKTAIAVCKTSNRGTSLGHMLLLKVRRTLAQSECRRLYTQPNSEI